MNDEARSISALKRSRLETAEHSNSTAQFAGSTIPATSSCEDSERNDGKRAKVSGDREKEDHDRVESRKSLLLKQKALDRITQSQACIIKVNLKYGFLSISLSDLTDVRQHGRNSESERNI